MDYTSRDGKAVWTGYTSQDGNAGEPPPVRAFLLASAADPWIRKARHNPQYVQPLQRLFLSRLNMHLSFKIRRVCVSEGSDATIMCGSAFSPYFLPIGSVGPRLLAWKDC